LFGNFDFMIKGFDLINLIKLVIEIIVI